MAEAIARRLPRTSRLLDLAPATSSSSIPMIWVDGCQRRTQRPRPRRINLCDSLEDRRTLDEVALDSVREVGDLPHEVPISLYSTRLPRL
jgi:hypothetical protein